MIDLLTNTEIFQYNYDQILMIFLSKKRYVQGGRCQVVKAVDCDSSTRGFESRRSP
jgi:hypothetical protein